MKKTIISPNFSLLICLLLTFATAFMIHSCKKDSKPETSLEVSKNKKDAATSPKTDTVPKTTANKYAGPCPYECDDPRCVNYSEPCTGGGGGGGGSIPTPQIYLQNFFSSYDTTILKSTDSLQVKAYLINKNRELIDILCTNFPQTYKRNELNPEDEFITWAGIIHMIAEGEGKFSSTLLARRAIDWGCVKGVVLGFFDMASLVEDYANLIKRGSSWSSVRGLLWRTAKRYGGWMAAAGVIYEITTECF